MTPASASIRLETISKILLGVTAQCRGCLACSSDLGLVKSVGYASEMADVPERLRRASTTLLEEGMLHLIEDSIIRLRHADVDICQIITGASHSSVTNWKSAIFRENAIFISLWRTYESSTESTRSQAAPS